MSFALSITPPASARKCRTRVAVVPVGHKRAHRPICRCARLWPTGTTATRVRHFLADAGGVILSAKDIKNYVLRRVYEHQTISHIALSRTTRGVYPRGVHDLRRPDSSRTYPLCKPA